ncbi:unnamed protein product [Lampetra fluviatilis]
MTPPMLRATRHDTATRLASPPLGGRGQRSHSHSAPRTEGRRGVMVPTCLTTWCRSRGWLLLKCPADCLPPTPRALGPKSSSSLLLLLSRTVGYGHAPRGWEERPGGVNQPVVSEEPRRFADDVRRCAGTARRRRLVRRASLVRHACTAALL